MSIREQLIAAILIATGGEYTPGPPGQARPATFHTSTFSSRVVTSNVWLCVSV